MPGIEAIIAVASGKGGVGKSTTAVNIALGLAANGLKVGVLDADIYGPSMPRLLNIHGRPQTVDGKVLKPMENYGLKVMSMGFLVDEETPMIWRGPMVMSALTQMLREVEWGPLDVLVVDMPPGTGDAQLTMAQQVPLAGAVIVSTPQDLALIDARKGLNMFKKVDVPLLGIVENMSYFIAPDTGKRYDIFGHGGARKEAERLGVTFLGEVPLQMEIRETSDQGTPIVVSKPDGAEAAIYRAIAAKVWERLNEERGAARSGAGDRVRVSDAPSSPLTFSLKVEKNSPASFFEVEVISRLPSWAILPPTSAFAAYLRTVMPGAFLGQVDVGAALGEAGDAALAFALDRVGVRRVQVLQRHRAGEFRLDRPDLQHDDRRKVGVGVLLQAFAARNALLQHIRIVERFPHFLHRSGDALLAFDHQSHAGTSLETARIRCI